MKLKNHLALNQKNIQINNEEVKRGSSAEKNIIFIEELERILKCFDSFKFKDSYNLFDVTEDS